MSFIFKTFEADLDVKAAESGAHAPFTGYASTFNNVDLVGDRIMPGAFSKSLRRRVPLLWQHDMRDPIGRIIKMREDDHGLLVEGRLNIRTSRGADVYELLRAGDIDSMSIGFVIPEDGSRMSSRGIREITEVDLVEVSLVTLPANPKATVDDVKDVDVGLAAAAVAGITGMPVQQAEIVIKQVMGVSGGRAAAGDGVADGGHEALLAALDEVKKLRGAINVR